ncbi:MAG: 7,8-didemethyl-8-hydroxy-5-deazariboflavin synthase subunit CofH [Roseofilum sp. SBFL]|uniref:7,8-didemethyl-8-hydroxy-5-deazariboflavin synthase subunit CofH n=1 Tax=unclassified Roseofilum TaxID=2620099 RepID=UPI001B01C394|nr:7,8-didemethyl-8-hydroxy-5-deazariboflavin synthase subunit CofH [Roseofilum sp. SID3]MBP0024847.1 7,8-didemethyl-8-hydroxy-5-deazariboflavin synthase subunit CofH [Roseofilum sp. SID2]MBP0037582.1 7,8-didemethyl-8-hydroxy-5-deazariboflavin synthase subunit CofH [Roseofilum sp. SID1]MBP0041860.1 7,8-didemethyl-8-hydroxy-5-deazariboflavin synthase subunit CofH [Roseofilum sp. SBFL]
MTINLIDTILDRALSGQDISTDEAMLLLQQRDCGVIEAIRETSDRLRKQQVGNTVTYVINRNINFTNICEQHCSFCAFRRDDNAPESYWLTIETMLQKTANAVERGATEICLQGGLNPAAKIEGRTLTYYLKLVQEIKSHYPQLHLHAFSPQEIQFIAREDQISYESVISSLQEAGLGSMPGTAAEVLDDRVRAILCPEKINTQTWVEIISTAHRLGMPTTSTLLSGHIETPQQQITHLNYLRTLQQKSLESYPSAITEFILLPFVGQDAPPIIRHRVGRDQPLLSDALLLTAVARIFLGKWIINHQPSWVKLGLDGATKALNWGCNDIGGTLMEEHISTMAGAQGGTCIEVGTLQAAIRSIGRDPQQRDTLYGTISG